MTSTSPQVRVQMGVARLSQAERNGTDMRQALAEVAYDFGRLAAEGSNYTASYLLGVLTSTPSSWHDAEMRPIAEQNLQAGMVEATAAPADSPPATRKPQAEGEQPAPRPRPITELLNKHFDPIRWAIPELLPEGAIVLGGRPKMGKSLLALNLGMAVSVGGLALGSKECVAGDVLYLALEDGERRLKDRTLRLLAGEGASPRFEYETKWPDMDHGGLEYIDGWLVAHPEARLVVVDTLKKLRPARKANQDIYDYDYQALDQFHQLALRRGVCILVVHHTRKALAEDFIEELSGSNGLAGAVDGIMVLKRARGQADAELHITGRDIDETALALRFVFPSWQLLGDAAAHRLNQERRIILVALNQAARPMGIKEVLEAIGTVDLKAGYNVVKQRLFQMKGAGLVIVEGGKYQPSAEGLRQIEQGGSPATSPNHPNPLTMSNYPNHANQEVEEDADGLAGRAGRAVRAVRAVRAGDTPPDASLPDGCRLVKCDRHGAPARYGIYWKVVGPDGEETEPDQHKPTVLAEALRRWGQAEAAD